MPDVIGKIAVGAAGRCLSTVRAGSGLPAVVFETGLGVEADGWQIVFQAVSRWTSVFRYDRANRGDSDPVSKPRTAGDLAADLRALLIHAAIPRPVVLVGHSLGGLIVRLYAHQHPCDVAGLVLIDPLHGDQFERTAPLFFAPAPDEPASLTQMRRFWTGGWRDPAQNAEGVDLVASQAQAKAIDSLGALPVIVVTAGAYLRDAPSTTAGQQTGQQLQALWREMHREMLAQSSNAAHILAEDSGHFIQREQPEVVIAAVRQMLEAVRGESALPRAE